MTTVQRLEADKFQLSSRSVRYVKGLIYQTNLFIGVWCERLGVN